MHAERALEALDHALAQRPRKDGKAFSEAVRCLCAHRDTLRRDGPRTELPQVNAVISVLLAGHFPIDTVPWDEVVRARAVLEQIAR